jgi:kynurenine formamidase
MIRRRSPTWLPPWNTRRRCGPSTPTDAGKRARLRGNVAAPGLERSEAVCEYLWNSHAAAIACDTFGVEVFPADRAQAHPFGFLHTILIGQFGMALGELWWLADLAGDCSADGIYEMFLVSAPMNAPGGIGSPANAVAIK